MGSELKILIPIYCMWDVQLGGRWSGWTCYVQRHRLDTGILAEGSGVLNELCEAVWVISIGRVGLGLYFFQCSYCNQNEQKRALETACHDCHIVSPGLSPCIEVTKLAENWQHLEVLSWQRKCQQLSWGGESPSEMKIQLGSNFKSKQGM